jgi:putative heme-binding domain-containing protein
MKSLRLTLFVFLPIFSQWLFSTAQIVAAADPPIAIEDRFTALEGFKVEEVVTHGSTGSLVAMSFSETGDIIASREQGPLLVIRDKDHDGKFESIDTFCDKVTNCQGILPLGEHVFAIGNGPSGTAFYRLSDADGDGKVERVETLFKFKGGMGEHGPHSPILGPDGLIYIMIGNHAFVEPAIAPTSPHHHYYDAELLTPKYEDANGHAAGIKAPGGSVVRTDTNGSFLELFVGGFRNAYDHAFNRDGELFTFDSDMEWDIALPWYRPTRVNHLTAGAEFGWRSGWSTWPAYFVDSLPETIDIGRGSPTGIEFYNHDRFGRKYQGALFMCDWSQGRILAVTMEREAGTYKAQSEIFLEGRPLNCADIGVGPDGWLYFCVGGRNTAGSIFRVISQEGAKRLIASAGGRGGVAKAIEQPQLSSPWARRAIRDAKKEAGGQWGPGLVAVAVNTQSPVENRVRALDLMQLFSPPPSNSLLVQLSADENAEVRVKATYLLGVHVTPDSNARLVKLLDDVDPNVRRVACESLVRARHPAPVERLLSLMAEPNRFVAWAARRALEQLPKDNWQSAVLASSNVRVFTMGSVALVTLDADRATAGSILSQAAKWIDAKPSDDDLVNLLRVVEIALHRGNFTSGEQTALRSRISDRFPTSDYRLNRELVRTLVMLQDPTLAPRLVKHLQGKAPMEERIQAAMLARFLAVGWTPELRGELLDFFNLARMLEGGNSYRGYLTNAANDVLKSMPAAEQLARIAAGGKNPAVALSVVRNLSDKLSVQQVAALERLCNELAGNNSAEARELVQAAIVALGHGDESALAYLHEVFESNPDSRQYVAQALSNFAPSKARRDADWQLLVRSLAVVEGSTARDVLRTLSKFPQKDDKPQDLRQVILMGLKLGDQGGREAAGLLAHWTGQRVADARGPWPTTLAAWQNWFAEKYPDQPEAVPAVAPSADKYTYSQLLDLLASDEIAKGSIDRGSAVFEKAQCVKCHRYGLRGEGIGPDLSNVSSRFQRKEILESVIFPSQVISDQFAAKTVVTTDGRTYTGIVGPTADGVVVLQANAEKASVAKPDIDEILPSKTSAMPDGLFNTLSLEEIVDLFAYLAKPPAAK